MKLIAALAFAALLAGCNADGTPAGYSKWGTGRIAGDDALAYTQSDSSCDTAGARERTDPASPCVLAPARGTKVPH